MSLGIRSERQLPRPWHDDSERQLLRGALDRVEVADDRTAGTQDATLGVIGGG